MSKQPDDDQSRSDDAEEERSDETEGGRDKASSRTKGREADAEEEEDDEDEEEEDDEDEEEEDDEDEGEEEVRPAPKKRASRPVKARPKRPPVKQLSEKEINSPEPQTLWMLGIVALMTLILWGFARFACNAHGPTLKPRHVTTQELARDPKDAAIELQQRWATKRYAEALELATGSAAAELTKDKKACDSNKKACAAESKKLAKEVLTTGALLSSDSTGASVRVTSTGPQGKHSYLIHLTSAGTIYKGDSRKPASAAAPHPAAAPPSAAPPATASAP